MGKQAKICIVILFAARSTSYFLNLAREQKSLATPVFESTFSHVFLSQSLFTCVAKSLITTIISKHSSVYQHLYIQEVLSSFQLKLKLKTDQIMLSVLITLNRKVMIVFLVTIVFQKLL
jgi:hypothetical protein